MQPIEPTPAFLRTCFPAHDRLPEDDVIAVGGEITPAWLIAGYGLGYFPWPFEARGPLPWCCPDPRAILRRDRFRLGKSTRRALRRAGWRVTIDHAFPEVIHACATADRGDDGTWIFPFMVEGYTALHREGHAHSVEVWEGDALVGGLYGVDVHGIFSGESMFHRRPNAGKAAVAHAIGALAARGTPWMDIQQLTPHMERMGAETIPRDAYLRLLKATQRADPLPFHFG